MNFRGGETVLPLVAMVVLQLGFAGMNILSKVALEEGMNPFVLVAYRQIVASVVTAPLALYLERNKIPEMNKQVIFQIFLCSLSGATGNQLLYFVGLKYTSATVACALNNTLPAFTFLLAIPFGLERVGMRSRAGQAKLIGTAVCIGGAMLLSFYHGHIIEIGVSKLTWSYAGALQTTSVSSSTSHGIVTLLLGPLLVFGSIICWSVWFILQAKMGQSFDAPYMTTTLMFFMSALQCTCAALFVNHTKSSWSVLPPIRLTASLYSGAIGSGFAFCIMTWAIRRKGPLYVSVFNPFLLVIVAFLSWALLEEKLYVGTAVGSVLIVLGLYAVLWGKNKEKAEDMDNEEDKMSVIEDSMDLELQQQQIQATSQNGYAKKKNNPASN